MPHKILERYKKVSHTDFIIVPSLMVVFALNRRRMNQSHSISIWILAIHSIRIAEVDWFARRTSGLMGMGLAILFAVAQKAHSSMEIHADCRLPVIAQNATKVRKGSILHKPNFF